MKNPVAYPDTGHMRHYVTCSAGSYDFVFKSSDASDSLGVKAVDLQFEYLYKDSSGNLQTSFGEWDSLADSCPNDGYADGLPKKIKIVLKTRDEEAREDTQTFETTVFIPGAE